MKAVLLVLFLVPTFLISQIDSLKRTKIDSLRASLRKDSTRIYRFQKVRPYLGLDNRNSFINNAPVNLRGIQLGLVLFGRHTIGFGLYGITQKSSKAVATKSGTVSVNRTLRLNYLTIFYQYAIIDRRYFEIDIPIEAGLGKYTLTFLNQSTGAELNKFSGAMIPLGAGVQAVVKPLPWLGISFLGGYRMVLNNTKLNFNGLYYAIGVNIYIREVVRDVNYRLIKKKRYRKNVCDVLRNG